MSVRPLSVADLEALARKYRTLASLRAKKDGGDESTTRATLRALAAEFPGSLRELDTLGATEIERRVLALDTAAGGGPREPWMEWVFGYHRLMSAVLGMRRALGKTRQPGDATARKLGREASAASGIALDTAFARAVARPPGGRLGPLVLRRLAEEHGIRASDLAAALFSTRRPSPYRLD